jgi:hypothetical protein
VNEVIMPNIASWFVPPDVQERLDKVADSVRKLLTLAVGDGIEVRAYILLADRETKSLVYEPIGVDTPVGLTVKYQGKVVFGKSFWGMVLDHEATLCLTWAQQIRLTLKEATSS